MKLSHYKRKILLTAIASGIFLIFLTGLAIFLNKINSQKISLGIHAAGINLHEADLSASKAKLQTAWDSFSISGLTFIHEGIVYKVKPEDLDVAISRDMVTIKGKRESERTIADDDYFHKELYWGSFSRTIVLPQEIDVDAAEAIEKHGLLVIKLPKLDKNRQTRLKVRGN